MSSGAIEEIGKTASVAIRSLASTPVLLALVLFQLIITFAGIYLVSKRDDAHMSQTKILLERCLPSQLNR
jgi:hypothetical protein